MVQVFAWLAWGGVVSGNERVVGWLHSRFRGTSYFWPPHETMLVSETDVIPSYRYENGRRYQARKAG